MAAELSCCRPIERRLNMAETNNCMVEADKLTAFCEEVFTAAGVPNKEAGIISRSLVDANLIGLGSHGVSRVTDYLARLDEGLINRKTDIRVISETAGTALLDAGNGWGQVASERAVKIAIQKAREVGVAWVGVSNSNHNGTAAYWTKKLAEAGMVGMSATNGSPVMAPFGGQEASLGTNPISIAVPSRSGHPVVLDMATSAQARGKILIAAKNGEPIPEGWALNKFGQPTTDAQEAFEGTILPMAGPKGSGLAMMIDILAGVLTGGNFGAHMPRMYEDSQPQRLGHFFMAVDIAAMMPLENFLERMDTRERETRESAPAAGFKNVLMPGDIEAEKARTNLLKGVELSRAIHDELLKTARRYGVMTALSH